MTDSTVYTLPIEKEDSGAILAEVGDTGLQRFGGLIDEEWHQDLRGDKAIKIYREMADNDPVIGASLFVYEMLIRQATWRIEPADDSPLAQEIADISTVSIIDTIAVIESLIQLIPKHITQGETVRLGDFGSFSIILKSNGADTENDFNSHMIKNLKIYFRPGKELKKAINDTEFEKEQ